ncbi:hypothetical protein [Variovorax ginsengisoli]|uniref:Uncharacterized protein n=1 Tax=Variovorax ginsengisoli TaxID=363844 RepID=A0ABT8SFU2_9BURK|nr:hypothetical protein [Variovorax ginsengisoli]MDN8617877.1 hypothetical protein [Variovorax ginsengisoli]MDO1537047.1 hypothetical protein [Variovorax ginsengisoli]
MTTIALPSTFRPEMFSMRLATVQRAHASPFGGSEQVIDLLNDRWQISLTLPLGTQETAASNEAFLGSLRGMTNTVNLWHMARRAPRGTMRGSPLCQAASQGASQIVISGLVGDTLKAGDMVGISGLLLQVAEDATANGSGFITTKLVNRLRTSITSGVAVTWDRPTVPFRLMSTPSQQYMPGYGSGVALDFAEVI